MHVRRLVAREEAHGVGGYVRASHFSRDYRDAYGVPPAADAHGWAGSTDRAEPAAV
ncbi:hypothetical protein [Agrococcus jejuensis]|uniref:hypothetical protein n=1 Tax=Agrococcus jejuensis TaxID=399736 RepID=UPI001560F007|nr:hypothetical protein [Agrococcus jejuensis]